MDSEAPTWAALWQGWELFRDPILCAGAAGLVLGFLGVYITLRRMVFVSAAVTQSAGLGVALAFYGDIHLALHIDPALGAVALALLATLVFSFDPEPARLSRDSLLGFAFALTGGASLLVGDRIAQEAHDIQAILFGSAVLVRPIDLWLVAGVGLAVLLLHLWWYRGLTFALFDGEAARVQGVPTRFLQIVLLVSIGAVVGVTARALGALPVFALSVLPATTALLVGARLPWTFAVAALLGALSGVAGYLLAFFLQFPVGGCQTVAAASTVLLALALRGTRALWQRTRSAPV
jgi:zinc transport system permease protein